MRSLLAALLVIVSFPCLAQEPKPQAAKPAPTPEELIAKLTKDLTGVKLVGKFTVTGRGDLSPKEEEYTITSATKLDDADQPDLWLIKARVKYGKTDGTFPIPLEIKWAGDTPVITLTNLEIPGLGTFSSRVVIYEGRYAGTWQHGDVGGHLVWRAEARRREAGGRAGRQASGETGSQVEVGVPRVACPPVPSGTAGQASSGTQTPNPSLMEHYASDSSRPVLSPSDGTLAPARSSIDRNRLLSGVSWGITRCRPLVIVPPALPARMIGRSSCRWRLPSERPLPYMIIE